jgi:enoyl-CoA hydratase/carnithine racemase
MVVALDDDDDVAEPVPPWLPCLLVAEARHRPLRPAPAGVDVAVCPGGAAQVPPGWVEAPDPAGEVAHLEAQVRHSPQASVVLAQLLRLGTGLDVDRALEAESLAYSMLQAGPVFASWLTQRRGRPPKRRREPEPPVLVERGGGRLSVTLNRPHVRNAVDARVRDALAEALALACADPSVTHVELAGAGPDFSSGGDLEEFGTLPDPATAHLTRTARSPARLLALLADRVTAHVGGACVGAGIELAAFAGTVVASSDTRCQLPEVSMGLLPGSGGTVSIPRRVGRHRTAWLGLSGRFVDAATALRWGLVDEVVAGARL